MGDTLVSGLVRDVVQKLTSIAIQEIGLLRRLEDDLLTLTNDFNQIQAVLEDAEDKHTKKKSVELWLKNLKSASLQVENVLDEVSTEAMLQRLHKERGIIYRVRAFFSSNHNQLMARTRIAHKVKTIRENIADIAAQKDKFNLTPVTTSVDVDAGVAGEMPNRETSSDVHSSIIFGRNEETEMVVEKICNNDVIGIRDPNDVRVYAIWGMGGLGKTTLAQLVYNHERVKNHFEFKCWMYVSEKFEVMDLIKGILESLGDCNGIPLRLDALQVRLQEKFQGKRFLVVLDDVWIEDGEKSEWDKLSNALSCGAEGSIVMVTTRNQTTSEMMAKDPELQHKLGCLSKEDSWSLFEKLAFARGRKGGDIRELEPIGKGIVEKCKGLPLAVKTLGGMMWSKSSTRDWHNVTGSKIWELQKNDILPALKLSYDNLLPHLKQCFAYCCMFPKGYEMEKDLLILLWMANGFIPPRGEASWYVLGEEIYNCLAWRSFFQVVDKEYKMHDLMHDLAQYVMRHDCSVIEPGKELITPKEVLHLSSSCPDFGFSDQNLEKLRFLRSIFMFKAQYVMRHDYKGSIDHILDFKYLRVLYLVGLQSNTLPESICKLKYLKYLNLSKSKIEVVPESIIYLQNLQMLLLEWCSKLRKLPEGMRYMRNLQHLNNMECVRLKYLPVGIKGLTGLRMLPYFPIDEENGARIGELGDLNLLEGELEIRGLENVGGLREAKNANLKCKTNLFVLKLYWWQNSTDKPERIAGDEEVLEGLEPNPSLKELEINGCNGKNICPWIVDLNNLVRIKFYICKKCEQIPPLGKLPSLKSISLEIMESLKCFHDEDYTTNSGDNTTLFPSLQHLYIDYCGSLVSLPSYFPKLKELKIEFCPNLVSLPSYFPKLKEMYINSCQSLLSLPDEIQSFKDLNQLQISSSMMKCEQIPPLGKLPSLRVISLKEMESLKCFHDEDYTTNSGDNTTLFPSLQKLLISKCPNLVSLPSYFPKLKELYIYSCDSFLSLPDEIQSFKDLNQLEISSSMMKCEQIPPLGKLPSLKVIKLTGLDSLKCFHDEDYTTNSGDSTTLFPSLQQLEIEYCVRLVSLPSYFPKLKELYINSCQSLHSLPDEIQSFKDLNQLTIRGCYDLYRRYKKESGVDWPKISHIPNIKIRI